MPTPLIRLLASLFLCALPTIVAAQPKPGTIPLETFLKRAEFREIAISPSGRYLAAISPAKGRYNLVILDLEKRALNRVTSFEDNDVIGFQWLTDDRITFGVGDTQEASGQIRFKGRYIINTDGSQPNRLDTKIPGFSVVSTQGANKDEIVISAHLRMRDYADLYRYNIRTGKTTLMTFDSPGNVASWLVDRNDVPRVAISVAEGKTTIWYRDGEKAPLGKFWEGSSDQDHARPIAFDYDGTTMYVAANTRGDKQAIYKWDFARKDLGEVVAQSDQADVSRLIFSRQQKKLMGYAVNGDKPLVHWLDPAMDKLQKTLDASLPNTVNMLQWAADNPNKMLVLSFSDTDPGTYYLLDPAKSTIEKAVSVAEWLKSELLSPRKPVHYAARDGLDIPAYLTIPKGAAGKKLPLVINVHGGPNVRGETWGYNMEDQLFASRGYVVLSPNFRGTTGLGKKLLRSGFKQWGIKMQDDLVDGAKWLVGQGIVDPRKICIYGGSYGGYATLYGVARDPDFYRCGVALVAVSDIGLLFDVTWSDTAQDRTFRFLDFDARWRIGDPDKDRDMFRKTSAVENAESIKAPLLLAYGSDDVRVPLIHGEKMRAALDRYGKKYEWVVYKGEGHGFNKDENRLDFYGRVLKFLGENLD